MKHFLILISLLLIGAKAHSQNTCLPPTYDFNGMTNISGTGGVGSVYRFTNSLTGINTFVTITKLQNASITKSNMDVAGSYAIAWQPAIDFTNTTKSGDSSYAEFKFIFVDVGNGANLNSISNNLVGQNCMAMTVVDCDGPGNANSFREMIKVSQTATIKGIKNSTITTAQDSKWISLISGTAQFTNIDTANYGAMAQINFPPKADQFTLRIGVVGAISGGTNRQFSFYFRSFTGLSVALPVTLMNFNSNLVNNNSDAEINWETASELNSDRFEIYRSFDGVKFEVIGSVAASGNSQELKRYSYKDIKISDLNQPVAYYKLRMIENNGASEWSYVSMLKLITKTSGSGIINVSPNPSTSSINVDLSDFPTTDIHYEIVDIYGKCIQTNLNNFANTNANFKIDISSLSKGLYFVHVINNESGEAAVAKFIKE